MRYARLADLVRLSLQMQGRADGMSLDDIGDTFEVSRPAAERIRDAIRDAFPQTEELNDPGGRKRWRLPPGTTGRLADPTLDDLAALRRGAELARQSGDTRSDRIFQMFGRYRACARDFPAQSHCWHLFRWGDQVEVVEPYELRTTMAQLITESEQRNIRSDQHRVLKPAAKGS